MRGNILFALSYRQFCLFHSLTTLTMTNKLQSTCNVPLTFSAGEPLVYSRNSYQSLKVRPFNCVSICIILAYKTVCSSCRKLSSLCASHTAKYQILRTLLSPFSYYLSYAFIPASTSIEQDLHPSLALKRILYLMNMLN